MQQGVGETYAFHAKSLTRQAVGTSTKPAQKMKEVIIAMNWGRKEVGMVSVHYVISKLIKN